jgi:hypothetical protein
MRGRAAVFTGPLGAPAVEIVPALEAAGAEGIILLVPDADGYDLFVRSRGPAGTSSMGGWTIRSGSRTSPSCSPARR